MRNVIFIISSIFGYGGMARVTIQIANTLSKLNKYNIEIISLSCGNQKPVYQIENKVKISSLPIKDFSLKRHSLKAIKELRRHLSYEFEGIIIVDDVGYTVPVYAALRKYPKVQLVGWSHMQYYNGRFGGFAWCGKRIAVQKFTRHIVLTKEDAQYYKEICDCKNIVQIYNPKNERVVRSSYDIESKKIISCGRLEKIKGFDLLIHVAKLVFARHPDWHWDIYGSGKHERVLRKLIDKLGVQNNVTLKGFTDEILDLYKHYSLDVFTSRSEGCPMAMIEAQSAGLPIVSFNFKCGPKDLIDDNVNGYIIPAYDISKMAEKICYLIEHPELRKAFSLNSELKHAELHIDYVLEQWQKILDKL